MIYSAQNQATALLDHVTVEYGGRSVNGANIDVQAGNLVARNATVRLSQNHDIHFGSLGSFSTSLKCSIVAD